MNIDIVLLDVVIEEMNNFIFCKGYIWLGFLFVFIGFGMVFDF